MGGCSGAIQGVVLFSGGAVVLSKGVVLSRGGAVQGGWCCHGSDVQADGAVQRWCCPV